MIWEASCKGSLFFWLPAVCFAWWFSWRKDREAANPGAAAGGEGAITQSLTNLYSLYQRYHLFHLFNSLVNWSTRQLVNLQLFTGLLSLTGTHANSQTGSPLFTEISTFAVQIFRQINHK